MSDEKEVRFRPAIFFLVLVPLAAAPALRAADSAAPQSQSQPPPLDFDLYMQGRHVYERNCVVCHGLRGDGNGELAATLRPKPRSFREGMFKFRTTPFGKLPADDDLRRTIRGGLSGTAMGMFTQLSAEEVEAVIVYVKSFSRRWRKAENHAPPLKLPPQPAWFGDAAAVKSRAEKGRGLFALHCASCHGEKADGTGPAAVALKDIWGLPAAPSDLRQPHLRCGDTPADIYRVLATGLNGTPMVSFESVLTAEQRWDIIASLFSGRPGAVPVGNGAAKTQDAKGE